MEEDREKTEESREGVEKNEGRKRRKRGREGRRGRERVWNEKEQVLQKYNFHYIFAFITTIEHGTTKNPIFKNLPFS